MNIEASKRKFRSPRGDPRETKPKAPNHPQNINNIIYFSLFPVNATQWQFHLLLWIIGKGCTFSPIRYFLISPRIYKLTMAFFFIRETLKRRRRILR